MADTSTCDEKVQWCEAHHGLVDDVDAVGLGPRHGYALVCKECCSALVKRGAITRYRTTGENPYRRPCDYELAPGLRRTKRNMRRRQVGYEVTLTREDAALLRLRGFTLIPVRRH